MLRTDIPPLALAQNLARAFAERAAEADARGALPAQDVTDLRNSGYLALPVPRSAGGSETRFEELVKAQLELATGNTSSTLVATMPLQILGHAREGAYGPNTRDTLYQLALKGALFNAAASEPKLGSPSRGGLPETELTRREDGFILNGHKTWTTGGEHLTHLLVRARLADEALNVLIENHAPGVRWEMTWGRSLSLRATDSHDVHFENVRVPADAVLEPSPEDAPPNAWFPLLVGAVYLGTAVAAHHTTIRYAKQRVPTALGKPIASLPGIQRQLGEMEVRLRSTKLYLIDTARRWQDGERDFSHIISAKHLAVEAALAVTDQALRVAGGASLSPDLPLERHFRDVRAGLMHPPSGDLALEAVGRAAIERQQQTPAPE